jgi:amino acid adenylation domain-containing protein
VGATLHELLARSAARHPHRTAVRDPSGASVSYRDLDALSDRLRDRLVAWGVAPGDRVGFYLRKSIDSIVSIFGILKCGAVYVPVDPLAPASRNAYILNDCAVRTAIVGRSFEEAFVRELEAAAAATSASSREPRQRPRLLVVDDAAAAGTQAGAVDSPPIAAALSAAEKEAGAATRRESAAPDWSETAYILYTSGSTGRPKGVTLTHQNAVTYVDWCSDVFRPTETDRLSSHAPLHFDLSILDVFLAIKHASELVLIGEEEGKDPTTLAQLISERGITIWYSAPSILGLLAQYGKLARYDYSRLRIVLFAGEVFPIKHLRALKALWPKPRYFNLYGPTETNVCTYFEVPAQIPEERTAPFPIGKACEHYRIRVVDADGRDVPRGEEGELCAAGPAVMRGYWNLPEQNARAFLVDERGERWYKTGDVVVEDASGDYVFLGRADRMVKRRGYRVELAEIEAGLYKHPSLAEVGVISLPDEEAGVKVKAFLTCKQGEAKPSLIQLKQFCAANLPNYMIPDSFVFLDALPKTSTGKTDYQQLKNR